MRAGRIGLASRAALVAGLAALAAGCGGSKAASDTTTAARPATATAVTAAAAPDPTTRDIAGSLGVGGLSRTYLLHLPDPHPAGRVPLVIALHGRGDTGSGMEALSRLTPLADRRGFAVVYPDGIDQGWSDGRAGAVGGRRDVDMVAALIRRLVRDDRIDPARVYVTGFSNGAMLSYRLGCALSDRIAAIAPVAGGLAPGVARTCRLHRPVALLAINGMADEIWTGRTGYGPLLTSVDGVAHWARLDRCAPGASDQRLPDASPRDHTRLVLRSYACPAAPVRLLAVVGGGHTWPGTPGLPASNGPTSFDVDATETIWGFFARQRLRKWPT